MKLPRDISGKQLASALRILGYTVTRQSGSHMRLTSLQGGVEHHITIPAHVPLKTGTLGALLAEVADARGWTREELLKQIRL
ncbi:MAG: type II toxin-antitoxin system HicA family toxin [Acidobacteria bacterium]|nr:type II toxin-antitoxin system HicA family toxin [Acidobacteriota bacterium]